MKVKRRTRKLSKRAVIEINDARHVGDYKVLIRFSDGTRRTVDFEPFLASSRNPLIRAYLHPEQFAGFGIHNGDLMWGDYELCFPVADLYENRICATTDK